MTEGRALSRGVGDRLLPWDQLGGDVDRVKIILDEAGDGYGEKRRRLYDEAVGYFAGHEGGSPYVAHYCLVEELSVVKGILAVKDIDPLERRKLQERAGSLLKVLARLDTDITESLGGRLGLKFSQWIIDLEL